MNRSLGLAWLATVAGVGLIAASVHVGCASDEDPAQGTGGTGGGAAGSGGGTAGSGGGAAGTAGTGGGTAGTGGGTAGTGGGTAGTGGGGNCPTGQASSVADIANGTTAVGIQADVKGAIATTKKLVVYFNKTSGSCLWGFFAKDPSADRGTMLISYGDNAPANGTEDQCPAGTDAIPADIVPGDTVDFVGEVDAYAPSSCTGVNKQVQVKVCSVTKTGSGAAPAPVTVSPNDLAAGGAALQGLLVQITSVDAEDWPDGGTVGPYGVIQIAGSTLEVHDKFYYKATGAPEFGASQHFNSIVGIAHLDFCDWVLQPRDKCTDFDPSSGDCI